MKRRTFMTGTAAAIALMGASVAFADPMADAEAIVTKYANKVTAWDGPTAGPKAQEGKTIVVLAGDLKNGGILGVTTGVEEAAAAIGWEVKVIDGAVVEVSDDGVGIAPYDRTQVTEPFSRMSPSSTGAGLGLTIVRDIMAAHAGTLAILARPGGGTIVRLVFPPRGGDG